MPYPAQHRERVREKIVDSARRLFNRKGFDNVSIASIMADAGLTHGAFYGYFKSKGDLYAEALGCFFTDPNLETSLGWRSRGPRFGRGWSANCERLPLASAL